MPVLPDCSTGFLLLSSSTAPAPLLGIDVAAAALVLELQQWLEDRELKHSLVRLHLQRAQQRMRRQANKHRSERSFNVGDLVFLKFNPMCKHRWLAVPITSLQVLRAISYLGTHRGRRLQIGFTSSCFGSPNLSCVTVEAFRRW